MSADDSHPQPVIVLRVVIRSPDLDTFVAKYSRFIKDDRIFIFTKSSQPAGTHVRFTLELSDGQPLIHGEGTVTRVRPETADLTKPPGMELKFVPLDERSRALTERMLKARDGTGQFREEPTDAQTQVRAAAAPTPEFEERPPTLPSLPQTGAFSAMAPALGLLPRTDPEMPRQDESGAVTLAQSQPTSTPARPPLPSNTFESPSTMPSGGFTQPVNVSDPPQPERHSGSYSSPTPLPAPIPAGSEESFVGPNDGSRPIRTATPPRATPAAEEARAFAAHGPAPPFAEAFRTPLPGMPLSGAPHAAPPTGTVPANPFSEVSDGAIEYFVEWSLEQSREAKPKGAQASFANVKMVTPHAEKIRTKREPFLLGMLVGLLIGVVGGAGAMWYVRGPELLATTLRAPAAPAQRVAAGDLATAPAATAAEAAANPAPASVPKEAPVATANPAMSKPQDATRPAATEPAKPAAADAAKPPVVDWAKAPIDPAKAASDGKDANGKPIKVAKAQLEVTSKPPGAAVTIDGQDKGKTPLTLTVPAGAHEVAVAKERYATVTQTMTAPGKLDVPLKRPTATLHVDSDPAGGDVVVEGKPRGKTPVDVTLEAFHHYDVSVTLLGTKPWHKRVSLKPPQVDVTAKLLVVHGE